MSSTPFSSQQQPAETESPFDWDGDEPALVRVRRLPEFQSWVKSGGLAEFAKQHGVQPDFIDRTCDVEPTVMIAYYEKLRSIPALSWEMDYERRRKPGSKLLSAAAVEAWMTLMEGWDIDEHDEDDEEQEEEKEEKKKEEAREKEEKETTAVGLVDKTVSPAAQPQKTTFCSQR
jgi:hypothetical protein